MMTLIIKNGDEENVTSFGEINFRNKEVKMYFKLNLLQK
jgi:hypothetical protein